MRRPNFNSKTMYLLVDRNVPFKEMQLHFSKNSALTHKKNRLLKFKHGYSKNLLEIYKLNIISGELLTNEPPIAQ